MKKYIFNKHLLSLLVSLTVLILFFLLIQPEGKPLPYIFVPVLLIWVILYSVTQLMLRIMFKGESRFRSIISFMGVSSIVMLVLLSGVGQLSYSDVILALALVIISGFYFYRMWS